MATRNQRRYASYDRTRTDRYVAGSAAPKYDVVKEMEKAPRKRIDAQTRKNREKALRIDMRYVVFMTASLVMLAGILYNYLSLQNANATTLTEISAMEKQLNTLKLDNDEEYSRIMGSVDLDQIKTKAIEELGMQYAQEGQIVSVASATDDYVHQYKDLP